MICKCFRCSKWNCHFLELTTLLHLCAIYPLRDLDLELEPSFYIYSILISTILSFLWHFDGEPNDTLIYVLDHSFAMTWGLFDFMYGMSMIYHFQNVSQCLNIQLFNMVVLVLNFYIDEKYKHHNDEEDYEYDEHREKYEFYHSLWHILSAIKAYYVSLLIRRHILDLDLDLQFHSLINPDSNIQFDFDFDFSKDKGKGKGLYINEPYGIIRDEL
jgi:hypothetical protein